MAKDLDKELFKTENTLFHLEAEGKYHLARFGDHLAKREKYKKHKGLDALYFYLVQKHHWPPAQVRALNTDDLEFLFAEEMSGWTVPKDAQIEGDWKYEKR